MKWGHLSLALVLVSALLAGSLEAQYYQRRDNRDTRDNRTNNPQPTQPQPNQPVVTGPSRAPESGEGTALPENQQPIPAPASGGRLEPDATDDWGFVNAMREGAPAVVRINMDRDRRAIGFLVEGPDDQHSYVVTNFFPTAGCRWIDIRQYDNSKVEIEGLLNYDEQQDLAIILVKKPDNRKTRILALADKDPKEGASVYAIGGMTEWNQVPMDWSAAGKVLKIDSGADIDAPYGTTWLRTDNIISQNNRGGPLLQNDGKAVGLCTSPGKRGRGPYLSVPVSEIRELITRENFGPAALYPNPKGGFSWPESGDARVETYSLSRIQVAVNAPKRNLECSTCTGHGYVITPQYRVDPATNVKTKVADRQDVCADCGGTGVVIKPSIHELLSSISRHLLNPDPKVSSDDLAKLKIEAQDVFGRAAVNRLILANYLTPASTKILEDVEKNRNSAVTFIAQAGPTVKYMNRDYQWVQAYETGKWILTYGVKVRSAGGAVQQVVPRDNRGRPIRQPSSSGSGRYVLVTGILRGSTTIEDNKKVYTAPLLEAADIVTLR